MSAEREALEKIARKIGHSFLALKAMVDDPRLTDAAANVYLTEMVMDILGIAAKGLDPSSEEFVDETVSQGKADLWETLTGGATDDRS